MCTGSEGAESCSQHQILAPKENPQFRLGFSLLGGSNEHMAAFISALLYIRFLQLINLSAQWRGNNWICGVRCLLSFRRHYDRILRIIIIFNEMPLIFITRNRVDAFDSVPGKLTEMLTSMVFEPRLWLHFVIFICSICIKPSSENWLCQHGLIIDWPVKPIEYIMLPFYIWAILGFWN